MASGAFGVLDPHDHGPVPALHERRGLLEYTRVVADRIEHYRNDQRPIFLLFRHRSSVFPRDPGANRVNDEP